MARAGLASFWGSIFRCLSLPLYRVDPLGRLIPRRRWCADEHNLPRQSNKPEGHQRLFCIVGDPHATFVMKTKEAFHPAKAGTSSQAFVRGETPLRDSTEAHALAQKGERRNDYFWRHLYDMKAADLKFSLIDSYLRLLNNLSPDSEYSSEADPLILQADPLIKTGLVQ